MKLFYLFIIGLALGSCAFNKSFYHPNTATVRTPPDASNIYVPFGEQDSIHALFYSRPKPKASLFILHGNAGNLSSWSEIADLFYQDGYQVFILDYPGFGNSTGKATHEAVFESVQNAVTLFNNLEAVKNTKKLIMGYSLGGNLALKVGADNPDTFDAMLIEGAFVSQKEMGINQVSRPFKFFPKVFLKNQIDGLACISQWNKPLLVIHSKDDRTCPYDMGKRIYDSAVNTTEKELWTIKGPHLSGLSANFQRYMTKVKNLITTD